MSTSRRGSSMRRAGRNRTSRPSRSASRSLPASRVEVMATTTSGQPAYHRLCSMRRLPAPTRRPRFSRSKSRSAGTTVHGGEACRSVPSGSPQRFRPPMADQATSRCKSGGFTLLELMIALAILSLVVLVLTEGMHFAGRAWGAQERRIDRQDDLGSLQNLLRSMIAGGRYFRGDASSLAFVGTMPLALAREGLFDIELAVSDHQLLARWRPHAAPGAVAVATETSSLARAIAGIDIRYYVTDSQGRSGTWSESIDKLHHPVLVRMSVLFAP